MTTKEFISCSYTQKVLKLCQMLTALGHTVYHYGCEGSQVVCTENVDVVSAECRHEHYSEQNDFTKQFTFDTNDDYHQKFYDQASKAIQKRLSPKDFVLCAWGYGHKPIVDRLRGEVIAVESGIGYPDTWADYRVFESYYWQAWCYGKEDQRNGKSFDTVIPNFFDVEDFRYNPKSGTHCLYLGRLVDRKGVATAARACAEVGVKLLVAGQGKLEDVGLEENKYLKFVGFADVDLRKELLASAMALICPTVYLEPFGGVAVEAMLSGTPVIASDWGAFAETVLHGFTGFRCSTLDDYVSAIGKIHTIDRQVCRRWAVSNYDMTTVALSYEEYFDRLYSLWGNGWFEVCHRDMMKLIPIRSYPFSSG